ncbi:glycerophosphodiester phosphodiesterase [Variovorax dokdonensis]|uniref:Glycerophosphodiester phosphodiesterase n=1 Tax=Variovorax dokdonensis TaxID=344883 RepID=A0ABT7NEB3_9BURK|nr:glycerophosphodiester phosphodiesterase [Variovorax dokdonensis]MDM0046286.1 glycerophosphodiester phosphodiesterase [Variovorax dokdonensis]
MFLRFIPTFRVAVCTLAALAASAAHAFDLQAHRGGRGLAPENTLAAFANAVALGVDTLELDVGLSADAQVVISHDLALNPEHTRDAQGQWLSQRGPLIHDLTAAQLQGYDIGRLQPDSAYGRQFPEQRPADGQHIPTLAALFAEMKRLGATHVRFNIETKIDPARPGDTAPPEAMVDALLAEIDRAGVASRTTVQSFDWRTLARVGERAPKMARAYLSSPRTLSDPRWTAGLALAEHASPARLVKAAAGGSPTAPVIWSPAFKDLTADQVKEAHALGLLVLPWTVNQPSEMTQLLDMGVDGIITDYPDRLRKVMQSRGMPLPEQVKP